MPGIEDAHEGLNQLSEQVGQFEERVMGISSEPRYNSIAVRALHAGRLATELAALVQGISDDAKAYVDELSPLRKEGSVRGFELGGLVDFAKEVTAGAGGGLSEVPRGIDFMGGSVSGLMALVVLETKHVEGYATKLGVMAKGLNRLGESLPDRKKGVLERMQHQADEVRATIERGKTHL